MTNHVDEKVILITGAGGGFGRILAEMTAAKGASSAQRTSTVMQQARLPMPSSAPAARRSEPESTSLCALISTTPCMVRSSVRRSVDVLVNNAGVMPLAFFSDHALAADAWDRAIDINFKGVLNGICAVYDQMIGQGRGHIVNISSIYGNAGTAGSGVYSATKAAVRVLWTPSESSHRGRSR